MSDLLTLPIEPTSLALAKQLETSKPTTPGMYLHLYHGRVDPNQDMDDWGEDGPYFGPIEWANMTYMCNLRIGVGDSNELWINGGVTVAKDKEYRHEPCFVDDMIYYDGMYYGEWSVDLWKGNE